MRENFVHLKLRSSYSVVDSVVRLDELAAKAQGAIALCDLNSLGGAFKFYQHCHDADNGVKPILGCTLKLNPKSEFALLCTSKQGLVNLSWLVSQVYLQNNRQRCLLPELLTPERCQGLLALSGGQRSEITQLLLSDNIPAATERARWWAELFPNRFYLEVQRFGHRNDERIIAATVQLAQQLNLPLVATNDVLFIDPQDYYTHEVRVAIARSERVSERVSEYSEQQYLKSSAQMCELFADLPSALANSVEIAKRCNLEKVSSDERFIPKFGSGSDAEKAKHLQQISAEGLQRRLDYYRQHPEQWPQSLSQADYQQRLAEELEVISKAGFVDYFLIVNDFVAYAHNNDIPVGPGRGSGAGSLVAYSLNITNIDPLKYGLFFERFLNPERKGMPDFDIDFCYTKRERMIDYMSETYGQDRVAKIIAYGSFGARGVIHDIVRVLDKARGLSNSIVEQISGHASNNLHLTLYPNSEEDRKKNDRDFYNPELVQRIEADPELQAIMALALKLEGLVRNVATHAAGIVIAPGSFSEHCPVHYEDGDKLVRTQWDKDDLEASGLVKFDFLGLRTLTIVTRTSRAIGKDFDIYAIPLDDKAIYTDICAGNTIEVFQLESGGMRKSIGKIQPANIEEITSLISLHRPGPMQFIPEYCAVKDKKRPAKYAHELVRSVLEPTYGVAVYQEQVMLVAQKLAGYSMGEADNLRREMSKKKTLENSRPSFVKGACANGLDEKSANEVFDTLAKFAGYGFNKAHAAAYALLGYQTAWLKHHHPGKFMVEALNTALSNTSRIVSLIGECQRLGFSILPPDVNKSQARFYCGQGRQIRFGLAAIRGLGAKPGLAVAQGRRKGAYSSIFDLVARVDSKLLNKRSLTALINSGACDSLGLNHATMLENLSSILQYGQQQQRGSNNSLGLVASLDPDAEQIEPQLPRIAEQSTVELVQQEHAALGVNLRHNPLEVYQQELRDYPIVRLKQVLRNKRIAANNYLPAIVLKFQRVPTRKGDHVLVMDLHCDSGKLRARHYYSNPSGTVANLSEGDLVFCSDAYTPKYASDDGKGASITVNSVISVERMRSRHYKALKLSINNSAACNQQWCDRLKLIKRAWMSAEGTPGIPMMLELIELDEDKYIIDRDCLLNPTDGLLDDLRTLEHEGIDFVER